MPHIWVEYSTNLEDSIDVPVVLKTVQDAFIDDGSVFPFAGARTRGVPIDKYLVVDGHPDNAFVHVLLKIAAGRSEEEKKAGATRVFEALKTLLAPVIASQPIGISVQMDEANPTVNLKTSNYRAYLKERGLAETPAA